jgi:long-chain acyl-CoA synthetase
MPVMSEGRWLELFLGANGKQDPAQPAVVIAETGTSLTYGELEDRSTRLARYLTEHGLRRGDRLAAVCGNDLRFFEVYWAALRSGLYITPVNSHLSASEVAYIVNDSGAAAVVISGDFADAAKAALPDMPNVREKLIYGGSVEGYGDYEAAVASVSGAPLVEQPLGAEMLYSSGTTGRPKGIKPPLSDRQVHEPDAIRIANFSSLYGLDSATMFLSSAPLYHASPLRFSAVAHRLGGTVVAMQRFDATRALQFIEQFRITHSMWVPTMFVRLLKLPVETRESVDLSSLKVAIHSGAPCPEQIKRAMIDWWGPIIHESFGSTEGAGSTFIDSEEWLRKPGSVGRARMGIIHICDEAGIELPTGKIGSVYFERTAVAFAYHNDPERTLSSRHPRHETWMDTGDIGYVDADGYLFLTDRKAFTIISGGVNIYPQEVEDCLVLHRKVYDAAVVGIPDPEMGQSVKAFVQLADGAQPGPDLAAELRDFVRDRIAHYKCPRSFVFLTTLPRTPTGKLVKRLLIEGEGAAGAS